MSPSRSSLLFTKVKLEEVLLGPAVALQTCEEMLQHWQTRYDITRARWACTREICSGATLLIMHCRRCITFQLKGFLCCCARWGSEGAASSAAVLSSVCACVFMHQGFLWYVVLPLTWAVLRCWPFSCFESWNRHTAKLFIIFHKHSWYKIEQLECRQKFIWN